MCPTDDVPMHWWIVGHVYFNKNFSHSPKTLGWHDYKREVPGVSRRMLAINDGMRAFKLCSLSFMIYSNQTPVWVLAGWVLRTITAQEKMQCHLFPYVLLVCCYTEWIMAGSWGKQLTQLSHHCRFVVQLSKKQVRNTGSLELTQWKTWHKLCFILKLNEIGLNY